MGKKRNLIYLIAIIIFSVVFVVCAAVFIRDRIKKSEQERLLLELAQETAGTENKNIEENTVTPIPAPVQAEKEPENVPEPENEEASPQEETISDINLEPEEEPFDPNSILIERGIEIPQKVLDFEKLHELNEDIYAWITVPGTVIDYPILQDPKDMNYYLDHTVDRTSGYPASIFTQYINSTDFSDHNTVIYGHNMLNGTMFASLHEFEDKEFIAQNPYIYIYTQDYTYVYEIFTVAAFNDRLLLKAYDFDDEKDFNRYLDDISAYKSKLKIISPQIPVTAQNRIVTLSTCIRGEAQKRFLVLGVLLNDPYANE